MQQENMLVTKQPNSSWGIASFIISLVCNVGLSMAILLSGIAEMSTPYGIDEDSLSAGLLGLLMFGMWFGVSLVLGIVGLTQDQYNKVLAILGTVFSAIGLLGSIFLVLIGLAMGG